MRFGIHYKYVFRIQNIEVPGIKPKLVLFKERIIIRIFCDFQACLAYYIRLFRFIILVCYVYTYMLNKIPQV